MNNNSADAAERIAWKWLMDLQSLNGAENPKRRLNHQVIIRLRPGELGSSAQPPRVMVSVKPAKGGRRIVVVAGSLAGAVEQLKLFLKGSKI